MGLSTSKFGWWVSLSFVLAPMASAGDECDSKISNSEIAQCFDQTRRQREVEVEKLYQAALVRMPKEAADFRSSAGQFVKEHAAWRQYMQEHCAFFAELMEGNSAWINTSQARCSINELNTRIAFLSHLPWNPEKAR